MLLRNKNRLRSALGLRDWNQRVVLGFALLAGLGLSACSDGTQYSYFAVQVSIDPASVNEEMLRSIDTCTLTVEGDDQDFQGLSCGLNKVKLEVGTAEFSTNKERGQLRFLVVMRDINRKDVARGESAPVAIVPNTAIAPIRTAIVARAVSSAVNDAGADMDAAPPVPSPDAAAFEVGPSADGPIGDTAP